jgi:hypothetical protein
MLVSRDQNAGQNRDTKITNRCFEIVSQFIYLGMTVMNQKWIWEEIKRRLNFDCACYHLRSESQMLVLWVMILCNLAGGCENFRKRCCLQFQGKNELGRMLLVNECSIMYYTFSLYSLEGTLKMEATCFYEMLIATFRSQSITVWVNSCVIKQLYKFCARWLVSMEVFVASVEIFCIHCSCHTYGH